MVTIVLIYRVVGIQVMLCWANSTQAALAQINEESLDKREQALAAHQSVSARVFL